MIRRGRYDASEAFANALSRGSSSPALGDAHPERANSERSEIDQLVAVAGSVRLSVDANPTPQFRADLRERVMIEADRILTDYADEARLTDKLSTARKSKAGPRRRSVGVAAAIVATIGVVGTASSSAYAAPGDALYPVKRGIESFQLAIHSEGVERGAFQLRRASERLEEAAILQAKDDEKRLAASLDDFTSQATDGANELLDSYAKQQSKPTIKELNDFVASSSESLEDISNDVPFEAQNSYRQARQRLNGVAVLAADLCTDCSREEVPGLVESIESLIASLPPDIGERINAENEKKASEEKEATEGPQDEGELTQEEQQPATPLDPLTPSPGGDTPPEQPPAEPTPSVSDLTDGLLGEEGLVPGLLGGLLQPRTSPTK